jgi:hypothetical protein
MDTFNYIILCPIGILTSIILFVIHISSKDLRKSPGDFIMMISLADFLLSVHWFSTALGSPFIRKFDDNFPKEQMDP